MVITEQVRIDFAAAAAAHQQQVHRTIRACGGPVMTLRTDRDWLLDIVRFVSRRKQRRRVAAGAANR